MSSFVREAISGRCVAEALSLRHTPTPDAIRAPVTMMTGAELAIALRFDGTTSAFRKFCKTAGINPLPGRKDCYDPVAVRHQLNAIQGLVANQSEPTSALDRSRMRRDAKR